MQPKIYVISLSPAVDYILKFDDLVKNKTNRPFETEMYPAGKGIHVSMILNSLDMKSESIVFTHGAFEEYFYKSLDDINVEYKKFKAEGNIRFNLKLIDSQQTECSATSPKIESGELNKLKEYLLQNLSEGDYLITTGSIPSGVDHRIYAELAEIANLKSAKVVVDSFGDSLEYALDKKPFLIKPNVDELSMTTKRNLVSDEDIAEAAQELLDRGVQNILISMGHDGAMLINRDIRIKCQIGNWNKKLVNAAGAGDSMLGGFVSEYIRTGDYMSSLKMGIICGSATAYSDKIATSELIEELSQEKDNLIAVTW
ncbi:1-phosphofructokinase family hexose kinase [[Acholeplasma] multilocale]|uniref:1-phosphofructokinase family hexose kinase n=1 Tax=[Acholeplasma] multilocale TaxID=264638 RepID=UPI000683F4D9|nr:1-phosphofructokinase family hexose kinase [[Acholeplasma] multilocale]